MLTFSPLPGPGCKMSSSACTISAFPEKIVAPGSAKNTLVLKSTPSEEFEEGIVSWPGEYNMMGVTIKGIGQKDGQQVSFLVDADDVRVLFLSMPLEDWEDHQLEAVGDIDVLVAPVTEGKVLQKLIDELDPRVLVLLPAKGATESVLKTLGAGARSAEYKMKGSLPAEGREVVVLED